CLQTGNWPHSF
nr:immunoglobulin light chain junction region [Macaca mulatta]